MPLAYSKVTAQGQISVPAAVRRKLGIGGGSVIEWTEENGRMVVKRSARFTFEDIHAALFHGHTPKPRTLEDLKEGLRRHARTKGRVKDRHARN